MFVNYEMYYLPLLQGVLDKKESIGWLLEHVKNTQRIANFRCGIGSETLALIWIFKAKEAFGIDIKFQRIEQARKLRVDLKWEITNLRSKLREQNSDKQLKELWERTPQFFKSELYRDNLLIDFEVGDVTHPTPLASNHYDLAFCNKLLHHIWYDEGKEDPQNDSQNAVLEMARVVKPGGIVASCSLEKFYHHPRVDFERLYKKARLHIIDKNEYVVDDPRGPAVIVEYICKKIPPHNNCL